MGGLDGPVAHADIVQVGNGRRQGGSQAGDRRRRLPVKTGQITAGHAP